MRNLPAERRCAGECRIRDAASVSKSPTQPCNQPSPAVRRVPFRTLPLLRSQWRAQSQVASAEMKGPVVHLFAPGRVARQVAEPK